MDWEWELRIEFDPNRNRWRFIIDCYLIAAEVPSEEEAICAATNLLAYHLKHKVLELFEDVKKEYLQGVKDC